MLEGARKAKGLTVIIDVFRAFSTACYIYANGARKIIPVADIKFAYELKKENPNFLLLGERGGRTPEGFDFGNSPSQIEGIDFKEKTVVQTTSSGTNGIISAKNADEIITGSFVNAASIVKYIKNKNPERVFLVAMGLEGRESAEEDRLCAQYLKDVLLGKPCDFAKIIKILKTTHGLRKFFDPVQVWFPKRDFELCLDLNKFSFVLKVEPYDENLLALKRINV